MRRLLIALGAVLLTAQSAQAQSCWYAEGTNASQLYCHSVLHTAQLVQAATGIALIGGNPVAGASSTLGMRIGSVPRISVTARGTGAFAELPNIERTNSTGTDKTVIRSINVDAAIGLLSGWSVAPTIGGVGSVDLVASMGKASLPDQFTESPFSWALGARIGVLRESFTMPGVSLTGLYRGIGDVRYGEVTLADTDAAFTLENNSALSLRVVAGKRLFIVGANVGLGWDKLDSDPSTVVRDFTPSGPMGVPSAFTVTRSTAFANLTWTTLILNAVIEGGYQRGGRSFDRALPSGQRSRTDDHTYYGSLALRLAL